MNAIVKQVHRATVALALPRNVPALIAYAQNILKRMTGNPSFPPPVPQIAAVTSAINDLEVAEAGAISRIKGAAAVRNDKRRVLVAALEQLRAYIQGVADADQTNGASIIQSAGVAVRKTTTRKPRVFSAKQGPVSGTALVQASVAARRASYEWQCSTDGGKTWTLLPPTMQSKTSVRGLTPGSTVQFKYRAVTKTGAEDWSQAVSLVIQ
jgi:hypothetical protein